MTSTTQAATFMLSGLVFRSMSDGHWVDFTRPLTNWRLRFSCRILSWILFIEAFIVLAAQVVGPPWALFLVMTLALTWFDKEGTL